MHNVHLDGSGLHNPALTPASTYFHDVVNLSRRTSVTPPRDEGAQQELEKQWIAFLSATQQTKLAKPLQISDNAQSNLPRPRSLNPSLRTADAVANDPDVHINNTSHLLSGKVLPRELLEPLQPIHPKPREMNNQYFQESVPELAMGSSCLEPQAPRDNGCLRYELPSMPPLRPELCMPFSSRAMVNCHNWSQIPLLGEHCAERQLLVPKRPKYFHITHRGCFRCGEMLTVVNGLGLRSDCFVCRLRWKFEDGEFEGFRQLRARAMWQRGFAKVMAHVKRC